MKTNNILEINATYTITEAGKVNNFEFRDNFVPKSNKKFNTLLKNAGTMMEWNQVSRMVIYMPDDFVNKNFTEVKPTIIEE